MNDGYFNMMSRSEQASRPSSARFGANDTSNLCIHDSKYRTAGRRAPTKPRAPRLLTSILPLVREPRANSSNEKAESRSWKLKDFSREDTQRPGQGAFPAPVPNCSTNVRASCLHGSCSPEFCRTLGVIRVIQVTVLSHSAKSRSSARHSTRSRSRTPHRLCSPTTTDTRLEASASPRFRDNSKIPAYHHCNNSEDFAHSFSEDYQGQWQWIRGHAKRQGQQLGSESDDCSSWYQSPFSATLPTYPTDPTATMNTTSSKAAVCSSPAFQSPIQPVSTASRPLMSSFRVPEHMGSYSASFSTRRKLKAMPTTAPPSLQHHQMIHHIDAPAPRKLEFSSMAENQHLTAFHMPELDGQLPDDIDIKPVDFVSVLQARHEAFCSRELEADEEIALNPATHLLTSPRSEYHLLSTPPHEPPEGSREHAQTTGGAKKGRIAAARQRLRQNMRVQRAQSADVMMFTNPCATPRSASASPSSPSTSPPFPHTEPSPAVPFGRTRSPAAPASMRSPDQHTSPHVLGAHHSDAPQHPHSLSLPTSTSLAVHGTNGEAWGNHAGENGDDQHWTHASYPPADDTAHMNGTLQLPGPPSNVQAGYRNVQMASSHAEHALMEQDKCLPLHSRPGEGLQRRSSCTELQEGSERLPLEYQVPPMNSSHGGATSPRTGMRFRQLFPLLLVS